MKKLLFLISVFFFASHLSSCGNRKNSKTPVEPIVENKSENIGVVGDTARAESSNIMNDTTASKHVSKPNKVQEAPKHNAPDQAKIDSIKAAKAKIKNK